MIALDPTRCLPLVAGSLNHLSTSLFPEPILKLTIIALMNHMQHGLLLSRLIRHGFNGAHTKNVIYQKSVVAHVGQVQSSRACLSSPAA
jgi:hypothetical protein